MADPTIGQGFNQDIATRYQPGQAQAEFYSQKTGQTFGNPDQLSSYLNSNYQGVNTTPDNVFGVLAGGYTPTSQALGQIKDELNNYQGNIFNSPDPSTQRQSSSITNQIGSEQGNYNTYLQNYNDLQTKLQSLNSPNYQQAYNDLRTQQGVPGFEQDYLNTRQQERNLPYVNRAVSGNAGAETETQLGADTAQKAIPLGIQESNLLDRLNLASQFIDNSLNFKQLDYNASRQSLSDAINTAGQAINMSHTHLNDLLTMQQQAQAQQQVAQQFAYDNRIAQPFYEIGGTVYRTSDRMPAHTPQEYQAMGGKGDFSDVQHVESPVAKNFGQVGSHVDQDGNVIPDYGFVNPITGAVTPYNTPSSPNTGNNSVGPTVSPTGLNFSGQPDQMRTDRNNNPTAMTTDVAKSLGLQQGVDYVQGDPFKSGNSTLYTAKLLGDPVQTTIKALDNAASTGKGAFQTATGKSRWSYINMSDKQWLSMTPEQKAQTVAKMYSQEGGSGQLIQGSPTSQPATTAPYLGIGKKKYDTVAPIVDSFGKEQTVQNFQAAAEAQKTANSFTTAGNSAQSQALLFAFAKALNPAATQTRQGTLDALASGAGSLLQQYGVDASRIFENQSTLSPEAVKAIQGEIGQLYGQYKTGYDNIRNQYASRIDSVAGRQGIGAQALPDYSKQPGLDPFADYANHVTNLTPEQQYINQITGNSNSQFGGTPVDISKAVQSGGLTFG
jgi:hypothetical protein